MSSVSFSVSVGAATVTAHAYSAGAPARHAALMLAHGAQVDFGWYRAPGEPHAQRRFGNAEYPRQRSRAASQFGCAV